MGELAVAHARGLKSEIIIMLASNTVLQNRYRILRLLGQGGMGAVYQAQDLRLERIVALKENVGGDPRQFQQEAVLLANLSHPNLPEVYDHFVEPDGAQYLVMKFVEGEDLQSRLDQQGALPEAEALKWFDQILDAVGYLHSRAVVHRDIKPANIKITPTGQAVLVDFGIAKVFQQGQMTLSGARAASPGFAAPEQYGGGTDSRSDIYSLGATLYTMLAGRVPPDALVLAVGSERLAPPRLLNPALSFQTEQVILCAMAVQPGQRFQRAEEMRRALKGARVAAMGGMQRVFAPPPAATLPAPYITPATAPAAPLGIGQNALLLIGVAIVMVLVALLGMGGIVWFVSSTAATPTSANVARPIETPTATLTDTPVLPALTTIVGGPTLTPCLVGVYGRAFNDLNGNQILDPGEPIRSGVQLNLQDASGATLATTSSDSSGAYQFAKSQVGTYRIQAVTPAGWHATTPTNLPVSLLGCGPFVGLDFGFAQTPLQLATGTPTATPRPLISTPAWTPTPAPPPPPSSPTWTPVPASNPNAGCVYPLAPGQAQPTPVSSKNNPMVTIAGHIQYTGGSRAPGATVATDKGGTITTDGQGNFTLQVHARPGVQLIVTVPQGQYTFIVDANNNVNVTLCIPRL
jgi:hypothetical protein